MIHLGAKSLSNSLWTCEPRNKLCVSEMQWSYKERMIVIAIHTPKGKKK